MSQNQQQNTTLCSCISCYTYHYACSTKKTSPYVQSPHGVEPLMQQSGSDQGVLIVLGGPLYWILDYKYDGMVSIGINGKDIPKTIITHT